MGHSAQAFFRYQLAGHAVNAVGFVGNSYESGLQSLYELLLTLRQHYEFRLVLGSRTLFEYLVSR